MNARMAGINVLFGQYLLLNFSKVRWLKSVLCIAALSSGISRIEAADAPGLVFPGEDWQPAEPHTQGVDASKLQAAVSYLQANAPGDDVTELVIIRNRRLIHQGPDIDKMHGIWSCTKSFTSTVLGLLVDEGKCSPNTRARDHVPEMSATYPEVTLRHFTTMTSGYRAVGDEPRGGYTHGPSQTPFQPNPEPLFPPGTKYAYWDSAMNQFGHVLTRIADEPIEELFKRRIADPIGMHRDKWDWGDFGKVNGITVNGGSGNNGKHLQISARENTSAQGRTGRPAREVWRVEAVLDDEEADVHRSIPPLVDAVIEYMGTNTGGPIKVPVKLGP